MQTFMPYEDFVTSAVSLDKNRLNKQIVEAGQLLSVLHGEQEAYKNHPAVYMWKGYDAALYDYMTEMFYTWCSVTGNTEHKSMAKAEKYYSPYTPKLPWWVGVEQVHITHQSRLNHKWKVDALKKRLGKNTREQKQALLDLREGAPKLKIPKAWHLVGPSEYDTLMSLADMLGKPEVKPWRSFGVPSTYAYIWPTSDGKFKTKPNGKWQEWKIGDPYPVLK